MLKVDLDHATLGLVGSARSSTFLAHLILGRNGWFCRSAAAGLLCSGPNWCSFLQRQTIGRTFSRQRMAAMTATSYNVAQDRWAYDIEPPESDKIRRAILNFTKR